MSLTLEIFRPVKLFNDANPLKITGDVIITIIVLLSVIFTKRNSRNTDSEQTT